MLIVAVLYLNSAPKVRSGFKWTISRETGQVPRSTFPLDSTSAITALLRSWAHKVKTSYTFYWFAVSKFYGAKRCGCAAYAHSVNCVLEPKFTEKERAPRVRKDGSCQRFVPQRAVQKTSWRILQTSTYRKVFNPRGRHGVRRHNRSQFWTVGHGQEVCRCNRTMEIQASP